MGTRNFLQTPLSRDRIALNATMYGYAGHSILTPHHDIKQLWWTDERIEAKVNKCFILDMLRGPERELLDKPFGEDLSDETYLSWILDRAPRLFLVLAQINCASSIFGLVDEFLGDSDLPLAKDDLERMSFSDIDDDNDALRNKFYGSQFHYLLRTIPHGGHIDYAPNEHIPMEYANSLPHAVSLIHWSRVHFPGRPEKIFTRRQFNLLDSHGEPELELDFLEDTEQARTYQHKHIASIWGSYTSEDKGYVLVDFVPLHTLRTFISHRDPPQYTRLSKSERPELLLQWMHGLADAVAYIHEHGEFHGNIRPSNLIIDDENNIAFSDPGCIATFRRDKVADKYEGRDYSAPENRIALPTGRPSMSRLFEHRMGHTRQTSFPSFSPPRSSRPTSWTSMILPRTSPLPSPTFPINAATHLQRRPPVDPPPSPPPSPPPGPRPRPPPRHEVLSAYQAADVYSLGAVFLDIVTFVVFGKLRPLTSFRSRLPTVYRPVSSPQAGSAICADIDKQVEQYDGFFALLRRSLAHLPPHIAGCMSGLLSVLRLMLSADPQHRPTAAHARNMILLTLEGDAWVHKELCCKIRERDYHPVVINRQDNLAKAIERCKRKIAEDAQRALDEAESESMSSGSSTAPSDEDRRRSITGLISIRNWRYLRRQQSSD